MERDFILQENMMEDNLINSQDSIEEVTKKNFNKLSEEKKPSRMSQFLSILKDLIFVFIVLGVILFFLRPIIVEGVSMEPTLQSDNYLIISRQAYNIGKPHRGDIVVFPHDDGQKKELYIKRVIGLPGDRLIIHNLNVWVNGKKIDENYIKDGETQGEVNMVVPQGKVFVMGDNRNNSFDSRYFGTVPIKIIEGKALVRLYPFNEICLF